MNKIESYIDSVIPKNIPKSKQQKSLPPSFEFFFENGKVTDAKMHYFTTDEWYSIIPQVIELS